MKCPNCGHEVEAGARFCTQCGYKIDTEKANAEMGSESTESGQPAGVDSPAVQTGTGVQEGDGRTAPESGRAVSEQAAGAHSEAVQAGGGQVKAFLVGYWSYFLRTLKHPMKQSLHESNRVYGYISFVIAALLLAVGFTQWMKHLTYWLPDFLASLLDFNLFQVFLFILIDAWIIAAVTYVVIHLIYKNHIDFHVFMTQYAGQGTPVLLLCALAFLIGLAGIQSGPAFFMIYGAFVFLFLPSTTMLFSAAHRGGMDRIYAYLITYGITVVVQYFAAQIAVGPVIEDIRSMISSFSNFGL